MKLPKAYNPIDYEANTYALWEASGAFRPSGQGEPYSIVMPPPNANGNLHIGHALFATLEDILTRYHRMQGRDTVWIPGADHAGFETWTVFENYLESIGDSRFNHTRDELYQMTWDFVAANRGKMEMQLRSLGVSCDWNNQVFTLDREVIDVVFTTFQKLWNDGLIYRGERIVNYCTYHNTSFADIEVEYQDDKGKLWYIDYPLTSGQGSVTVATTRPETMLGDEAVAVNPNDQRYAKLIGQSLNLPLVGKPIPIIADEAVEYDFGTGAVKVTPAHDPTDFEIGQRHNLPVTSVIGFDGLMVPPAPEEFVGLDVDTARRQVVEQLEVLGLISQVEDYQHQVPHCYKCGRVIQPLVKDQWFISVQPLAQQAISAIKAGRVKFTPQQKADELIRYYEELRDWNISRQIPWGIPIPAFQSVDDPTDWVFDRRVDKSEIELKGKLYKRDEDTFDTWFSSGQWPYIVTRGDLERFYPTTVMETGIDILRAWVSRMIMLGLYISDEVPFKQVYFHGLVNDEHNQKMSKSKGNVINPMTIIDEYGADAMRLGVIANRSAALSQAFSPATVVAGRNFCNKLWNIARFVFEKASEVAEGGGESAELVSTLASRSSDPSRATSPYSLPEALEGGGESAEVVSETIWRLRPEFNDEPRYDGREESVSGSASADSPVSSLADNWILRQLDEARVEIEKFLAEFRFAEAYETLYHTIWDDVADWWVESVKAENSTKDFNLFVLEYCLKLAHPFAPFVTETIWQSLLGDVKSTTLLILQQWPRKPKFNAQKAADFDKVIDLVREIRKTNIELGGGKRTLYTNDDFVLAQAELIKSLSRIGGVEAGQNGLKLNLLDQAVYLSASDAEIGKFEENLIKKTAEVAAKVKLLKARLANQSYVANAPAELVAETRAELKKLETL